MTGLPLILASGSVARKNVLSAAGVPFEQIVSDVDEDAIKRDNAALDPLELVQRLAVEKARAISDKHPDRLVLGCDQVLVLEGEIFDKPNDLTAARSHLKKLSGRVHQLLSAAALVKDGNTEWMTVDTATLSVRALSDDFIDRYLSIEGDAVLSSVGAYRLESIGIQLFSKIVGDHHTILGLPLLPLLAQLRTLGFVDT